MYSTNSVKATPVDFLDRVVTSTKAETKDEQAANMRAKLKAFALPSIYISVLIRRFVYGWSYDEIATALSIPHRQTVHKIYLRSLELLREREYE